MCLHIVPVSLGCTVTTYLSLRYFTSSLCVFNSNINFEILDSQKFSGASVLETLKLFKGVFYQLVLKLLFSTCDSAS